MNKKDKKKEISRLQSNKAVIVERIEFLEEIEKEMTKSNRLPSVPLGGLFDDILKLNPERAEQLVPLLLETYKDELQQVEKVVVSLN